jgi:hypothetical protein
MQVYKEVTCLILPISSPYMGWDTLASADPLQPPFLRIQFIDSLRNISPTDSYMHFFSP